MRLLSEFDHCEGVNREGTTVRRDAVRAVALKEGRILLLYSTKYGDYHFPGGGVKEGEDFLEALSRELMEECGAELLEVHRPLGKVVEYKFAKEEEFETFCMTSYYYFCSIGELKGSQYLEDYEVDLGLEPRWITLQEALRANEQVMANGAPPWVKRGTMVLRLLAELVQQAGSHVDSLDSVAVSKLLDY